MTGMILMNTHLKGVFGFRVFFDLDFLFIVEICHDVQTNPPPVPPVWHVFPQEALIRAHPTSVMCRCGSERK